MGLIIFFHYFFFEFHKMEKMVLKNENDKIDKDIIEEYMLSTIKSIKEGNNTY